MSYSIREALHDGEERLAALAVLAQRYPTAEQIPLPDGTRVWGSATIEPTDFLVVPYVKHEKVETMLCPYELVEGIAVFALAPAWEHASVFFSSVKKSDPDLHAKLLARFG